MIYELFNFYNEFDMLEMKLQEHSLHVDNFIICESNRSSTQVPKEYRLKKELAGRYARWRDKITLLEFDAAGLQAGWDTFNAQRNYQISGQNFSDTDILLFSDLDEFLLTADWQWIKNQDPTQMKKIVRFESVLFWCYANMIHSTQQLCVAMVTGALLQKPSTLRRQDPHQIGSNMLDESSIRQGGLHLSWFGSAQQLKDKIHGSVEAHNWGRSIGLSDAEMQALYLKQKNKGLLFAHRAKFKPHKIKKISLDNNQYFSQSMKSYIQKHPEWLFPPPYTAKTAI